MSRRLLGGLLLLLVAANTWLGVARIVQGVVGRRAEWDIRDGRLDRAWSRLERVRAWQPGCAPPYVMAARAVSQARANGLRLASFPGTEGRPDSGVSKALLARAIDLSPADAWAWFTLAEAAWAEESARDRLRRLRSVAREPPGQAGAEPAGLRPLDGLILAATRQAQWLEPGWFFYHDFLARLLDRRGESEAAARELAAGYALMPRPSAHDVLGDDLLRRYPEALAAGLARAEADGRLGPVSLAWGRAETLEFLGRDEAALAAWRELSGLVDRQSRALTDYAAVRILARSGDEDGTLAATERFLEAHAGNRLEPGVLNLRAQAFSRLGRHREALEALRRALGVSPRPAAVLVLMGRESELMGDAAEAERLYRAALAREPDWLAGVRTLAQFLERTGRRQDALEVASSHARRHPHEPEAAELVRSLAARAGD